MKNQLKTMRYVVITLLATLLFFSHALVAKEELKQLADRAAKTHGIDPHLFRSLIHQESRWKPQAVSPDGAVGLTQLKPETAKATCGLNFSELKNPEKNLNCGAKYLSQQLDRFNNDVERALCAFNAGPNITARLGRCPNYPVTRHYVKTIMGLWEAKRVASARSFN
ncbi:lytic transglycosylase domain-containing protein [Thioflexithrix psekupsensis]|uniref:Transglycosylase SLT domain-containing protein n=1 Tax=Thioflexithrix psekupsensis TaxID=1570016 RepID=A0A251XAV0_9GAMM|nr:lytic transglycosylase domain-containing protein [Thioflexithrix psekupsensis]OUD15551.1 hypothetical protein TPSD3_03250 [Thioflexithrix psekupsensis]